jgi:hypothetical protein
VADENMSNSLGPDGEVGTTTGAQATNDDGESPSGLAHTLNRSQ